MWSINIKLKVYKRLHKLFDALKLNFTLCAKYDTTKFFEIKT